MRGLRFPSLQLEPAATPRWAKHSALGFRADSHGAFYQREDARQLVFRAYVPEPVVQVNGAFELKIGNVHPQAHLNIDGDGNISEERVDGLVQAGNRKQQQGHVDTALGIPKAGPLSLHRHR